MHCQDLCIGLKHFNVNFPPLTPAPGWLTHPSHFCLPPDYSVFQVALRGRRYSPESGEWKILFGGIFYWVVGI